MKFYFEIISNLVDFSHRLRLHFSNNLTSIICLALSSPSRSSSSSNRAINFSLHCSREGKQSFPSSLGFNMSSKNFSHVLTCHHLLKDPFTTQRFLTVPTSMYLPNKRQYAAPVILIIYILSFLLHEWLRINFINR